MGRYPAAGTPTAADLVDLAGHVLPPEGVASWLLAPNPELGGDRPADFLDSAAGRRRLEELLKAL